MTPKTDANGNIVEPSQGAIFEALKKTGQKFNLTGGYYDNGDSPSGSSSGDVVESAKMVAASGDYAVYDFKPGRNTFIDAETGDVRFIDPRVDINDPSEKFAFSKYGRRRRTDARFDIDAELDRARAAKSGELAGDETWTAEDEARLREMEEEQAEYDYADFERRPPAMSGGSLRMSRPMISVAKVGDESHLLKWYEPVGEEQMRWIREGLRTYDFRLEKVASPSPGSPKSEVLSPRSTAVICTSSDPPRRVLDPPIVAPYYSHSPSADGGIVVEYTAP